MRARLRLPLLVAVAAAWGVKRQFSAAAPGDLAWILAPTAWLAGLFTGAEFEFEAGTGWIDHEARYIVAPACAGVNFLVAAFCTLAWTAFVRRDERPGAMRDALRLGACGAAAFGVALFGNALRLSLAIWIHGHDVAWLAGPRAHRLLGLAVYLPLLFGLHRAAEALLERGRRAPRTRGAALHVPVLCYLALTVFVPLANGARALPAFGEHAATVVAGVLLALLAAAAAMRVAPSLRRRRAP